MKKILILAAVATASLVTSCTKDLTDLNVNTKAPEVVPAGSLFANATIGLVDYLASPNVNTNNFRLWSQHWTESTYTEESNFLIDQRDVNGSAFDILYTTVIRDLEEAKGLIAKDIALTESQKKSQIAMADILQVYTYSMLVDIFGDVPYYEALTDDVTPVYNTGEEIYTDLLARLNTDVANLSAETGMGSSDLLYGGDGMMWKKFASSLALRMAVRISDHNPTVAGQVAAAALASGVFTSSADDAKLNYLASPPYTNPLYDDLILSGRTDFVAANTLGDIMNTLEDPRRGLYFRNLDANGDVTGGTFGDVSPYTSHSQPSDEMENPTHPGVLLSYVEVEFLLAHCAQMGVPVGGSAASHYDAAVRASIIEWGGSNTDADAYLAQADVAYSAANWRERIGTQKWIAMYDVPLEAWSAQRMYDYPAMNVAPVAETVTPKRFHYGIDELTLNKTNCEAAGANYNGDSDFAPIFWDKN
jgi:Starch-binding associating with outer membrane